MVIDFELQFKQLLIAQDEITFNEFYLQTVDIFSRYLKANYALALEDSEDVLADFYVKCRNGFPKYDSNQNFSGYVWSIFKNNLKDFWKRKEDTAFSQMGGGNEAQDEQKTDFEDQLESPDDFREFLEAEFTFEHIKEAMMELDEATQEIIFLKFIEEKEYGEIAEILQISQDSARQRCSRAVKQLKKLIEEKG